MSTELVSAFMTGNVDQVETLIREGHKWPFSQECLAHHLDHVCHCDCDRHEDFEAYFHSISNRRCEEQFEYLMYFGPKNAQYDPVFADKTVRTRLRLAMMDMNLHDHTCEPMNFYYCNIDGIIDDPRFETLCYLFRDAEFINNYYEKEGIECNSHLIKNIEEKVGTSGDNQIHVEKAGPDFVIRLGKFTMVVDRATITDFMNKMHDVYSCVTY